MTDNQALSLSQILRTLATCDYQRDLGTIRNLTYEILSLATNGADVKHALPMIVKLLAHPDAFIKRVTGEILAIHDEEDKDITLLAINTLTQDCKDINPVVRSISYKILGSLKTKAISEVLSSSIVHGLSDKNGYVRRSAALASIHLNKVSPSTEIEGEIWDQLYYHLRDDDATTVAACLCALEEVCAQEKGIVMSNKLGQYLISKIHTFTPNVQRIIIQFLLKFSPKTKDQMFDNLNYLDHNLAEAQSFAMLFSAYQLFYHFTQDLHRAQKKLTSSAWSSFKTILARERNEEMISAAIHFITSVNFSLDNCSADFNKFSCHNDDHLYLTHHKIRILMKMITVDNAESMFSQYLSCVRTMNSKDMKYLVQHVSKVALEKPDLQTVSIDFLKNLMATEKIEIMEEVLKVLPSVCLQDSSTRKEFLPFMEEKYSLIKSYEAKTAILHIIKNHVSEVNNAADILEDMSMGLELSDQIVDDKKKGNADVQSYRSLFKVQLLGAMVQVFLLRPALIQPTLAKLMECCIKDEDRYVKDKALMYYAFLVSKVNENI